MRSLSRTAFGLGISSAFAAAVSSGRAAQFNWKLGHDYPASDPMHARAVQACARIKNDTAGAVEIRVYPDSTLGSDPAMLAQMRVGALEMLAYAGGILDGVVPIAAIESIAFAFPTLASAHAAMDGDLGAIIRQAILDKGMMPMEKVWDDGFREFMTSKWPINSVNDLKGLKLRVAPSKLRTDTFQSLGASVTPIPASELYVALQTKIVDGMEAPLTAIQSFRFYEVQKYCSLTHHMWTDHWMLANLEKWNGLPKNYQEIIRKNLNEGASLERHDDEVLMQSVRGKLEREGIVFNEPSPESFKAKLAAAGYYGRWRSEFGDTAWTALEKYAGRLR